MGYLYLTGQTERLLELARYGLEAADESDVSTPAAAEEDSAGKE